MLGGEGITVHNREVALRGHLRKKDRHIPGRITGEGLPGKKHMKVYVCKDTDLMPCEFYSQLEVCME